MLESYITHLQIIHLIDYLSPKIHGTIVAKLKGSLICLLYWQSKGGKACLQQTLDKGKASLDKKLNSGNPLEKDLNLFLWNGTAL